MDSAPDLADSHRLPRLGEKFRDKRYRDGYVAAHTRSVFARQMRNFRGNLSQADFAEKIGKQKTMVSRLENPAYGGWSLRTMLEVARKLDLAIFARFVDFATFLKLTDDLSDAALNPAPYDQRAIDELAREEGHGQEQALKALFSPPPNAPSPPKALEGMEAKDLLRIRAVNDDDFTEMPISVLSALS